MTRPTPPTAHTRRTGSPAALAAALAALLLLTLAVPQRPHPTRTHYHHRHAMTSATATLALVADLEAALDRQRSACAGMAHATACAAQTTVRARRLAGDARALLEEATD